MISVEIRHYVEVQPTTTESFDYVVPAGKHMTIRELGGDCVSGLLMRTTIIWDPASENRIIFSSNESTVQSSTVQVSGDGLKTLRIELDNQTLLPRIMGAYFIGDLNG